MNVTWCESYLRGGGGKRMDGLDSEPWQRALPVAHAFPTVPNATNERRRRSFIPCHETSHRTHSDYRGSIGKFVEFVRNGATKLVPTCEYTLRYILCFPPFPTLPWNGTRLYRISIGMCRWCECCVSVCLDETCFLRHSWSPFVSKKNFLGSLLRCSKIQAPTSRLSPLA